MTSLKDRLQTDTKAAMLARDSFTTDTLKGLKSAILNQEIADGKRDAGLSDTEVEILLAREAKKRDEAAELYEQGGNIEMAQKERAEKKLIAQYLPQQLSEQELQEIIDKMAQKIGATTQQDMGRLIGAVKAQVGTTGDGATIAKLAKNTLQ